MKRRWVGNNVDMVELRRMIIKFFENKLFKIIKKSEDELVIAVPIRGAYSIIEHIKVFIRGSGNDFSIRFEAGKYSHKLTMIGTFTTLIGGGSLFLRGVKSEEELKELEKEFWNYISVVVNRLSRKPKSLKKRKKRF